ncbi:MAG TPA: DUF2267 domain-containing protein [Micromonosporaceae bacterium]|jgi:uncharacterized protein (DUF2267 family)
MSEQFLERVRRDFPYSMNESLEALVQVVLRSLRHYTTEGEWDDVKSDLPRDLTSVPP